MRSHLGSDDPVIDGYIHYEDYRLRLREDEAVQIDMDAVPRQAQPSRTGPGTQPAVESDAGGFDPYLEVRRPRQDVPLAENDDRSGPTASLNSSLIFAPPAAGDYVVRARTLDDDTGDYVLRVTRLPPDRVGEISLGGAAATSRIDVADPAIDGRYYEEYRLRLGAGEVVQIDMEATSERAVGEVSFDPFLAVFAPGSTSVLDTNDDRGDSLDARLVFVAPASGVYRVRAQGLSGTTGEYRLAAARLPAMPQPDLLADDRAQGRWFNGSHSTMRDGLSVRFAEYRFDGSQGERVRIDANSNLVSHLMLGALDRAWFAERRGARERAQVSAVLPRTGTYIVRLEVPAPYNGTFQLRLTRAGAVPLGDPPTLDRSRPLEGRLGLDSGLVLGNGDSGEIASFYRIYALPVQAGETIVVTLDSNDFDTVLDAGTMSILGYTVAVTNDDGDSRNSRLELRPTGSDTVYLRVRSFRRDIGEGRFTLRVTPQAPSR